MENNATKTTLTYKSVSSNKPVSVSVKDSDYKQTTIFDSKDVTRVTSKQYKSVASSKIVSQSGTNIQSIKSQFSESIDPYQYLGPEELLSSKTHGKVSAREGFALSTIFDDLEEEMHLYGEAFPGSMSKTQASEFLNYDDRFRQEVTEQEMEFLPVVRTVQNPFEFDEATIGTLTELEAKKIQNDRAYLQEIVRRAKQELSDRATFEQLNNNIENQKGWKKAAIMLIDQYQESKNELLDLCQKTVDYANDMNENGRDRKEIINFLKDKVHLTIQKGKQDQRYTRAFLEAQNDHNLDILNHELHLGEMKMNALDIDMARDKFCHRNVEDYFALVDWDIQKQIDHWNLKFETDLEEIDKSLNEKQNSIRAHQIQIDLLNKAIEERMLELGPWEEQKRKEREDRADYLRLYYSARKIQRWWRQYMVKHKLYKKKKGKKGKGEANMEPANQAQTEELPLQISTDGRFSLSATTTSGGPESETSTMKKLSLSY